MERPKEGMQHSMCTHTCAYTFTYMKERDLPVIVIYVQVLCNEVRFEMNIILYFSESFFFLFDGYGFYISKQQHRYFYIKSKKKKKISGNKIEERIHDPKLEAGFP